MPNSCVAPYVICRMPGYKATDRQRGWDVSPFSTYYLSLGRGSSPLPIANCLNSTSAPVPGQPQRLGIIALFHWQFGAKNIKWPTFALLPFFTEYPILDCLACFSQAFTNFGNPPTTNRLPPSSTVTDLAGIFFFLKKLIDWRSRTPIPIGKRATRCLARDRSIGAG